MSSGSVLLLGKYYLVIGSGHRLDRVGVVPCDAVRPAPPRRPRAWERHSARRRYGAGAQAMPPRRRSQNVLEIRHVRVLHLNVPVAAATGRATTAASCRRPCAATSARWPCASASARRAPPPPPPADGRRPASATGTLRRGLARPAAIHLGACLRAVGTPQRVVTARGLGTLARRVAVRVLRPILRGAAVDVLRPVLRGAAVDVLRPVLHGAAVDVLCPILYGAAIDVLRPILHGAAVDALRALARRPGAGVDASVLHRLVRAVAAGIAAGIAARVTAAVLLAVAGLVSVLQIPAR